MGALKSKRCSKGHRMRGANVYHKANGDRECRACSLARNRKWRKNQKG